MRSIVSAVKIHAVSAEIKMTILIHNIFLTFDCRWSCIIFLIPCPQFLKVVKIVEIKPIHVLFQNGAATTYLFRVSRVSKYGSKCSESGQTMLYLLKTEKLGKHIRLKSLG